MAQEDPEKLDQLFKNNNNQFSTKMYSGVVKSNPGKSMVLSAYSVLVPLAQLSLASEGASHDELLKAVGLPNDDVIKCLFPRMYDKLHAINGIELKTASKIYVSENIELNPEFAAVLKEIFKSEVKNVNFSKNIEAADEMNRWVEIQTNNHIKDLVSADDLNADTCSILLNAIYFMGNWDKPFDKENTKEEDFHISKDQTIMVPMMHNNGKFRYSDSSELNAHLLELPYKGREASFVVILPKEMDGLAALEERLKDPAAFENATLHMQTYDVDISLPRLKIETKIDLKEVLEEMDVKHIFDSQHAQLRRLLMNEYNAYVSKATQKAFIVVNEEGAEAGAANEFKFRVGLTGPSPTASFIADKPFYYALTICNITILSGRYVQ